MQELKVELEKTLDFLKTCHENYNNELVKCPEGVLYRENRNGNPYYFRVVACGDNKKRKSIARNESAIKQMARKKYLELANVHLEHNIKRLQKTIEDFETYDSMSILSELPSAYSNLPEWYFYSSAVSNTQEGEWQNNKLESLVSAAGVGVLTDIQRDEIRDIQKQWAAQNYEHNTKNTDRINKITSRGLRVRSKSEVMIAEKLYHRAANEERCVADNAEERK